MKQDAALEELKVDAIVACKWRENGNSKRKGDPVWLKATVIQILGKKYWIKFDTDKYECVVTRDYIRKWLDADDQNELMKKRQIKEKEEKENERLRKEENIKKKEEETKKEEMKRKEEEDKEKERKKEEEKEKENKRKTEE